MTQTLSTLGLDAPEASALSEAQLLDVYRTMRLIRAFEDRVHKEFATGDIPGFVHLYAGEEASATGVCAHLDQDRDTIASDKTHRGHAIIDSPSTSCRERPQVHADLKNSALVLSLIHIS